MLPKAGIALLLLAASATPSPEPEPAPGSFGFNWLEPASECREITAADIATFKRCEASANAFGLDLASHACKVDADTEFMVYATADECQQALETMQANGP
jgi:hypothetical protein